MKTTRMAAAFCISVIAAAAVGGPFAMEPAAAADAAGTWYTGDKDAQVRGAAANALGEMTLAARSVVPALISAINDTAPDVRVLAVYSLARIGPEAEAALPALLKQIKQRGAGQLRQACVGSLGNIGAKKPTLVMPVLLEALQDPEMARSAAFSTDY